MRTKSIIFLTITLMTTQLWAGNVSVPNTFVNGTTASADEVNENFDSIESAVNDNDARINSIRSLNVLVNGVAIGAFMESAPVDGTSNFIFAEYIRVLLDSGYIVTISTAGDGLRHVPLRYQSTDCTGQPYFAWPDPNIINPIVAKKGAVLLNDSPALDTLYFVQAGSAIENITVQSQTFGGECNQLGATAYQGMQVLVNDSIMTGVTGKLAGDITIE